MAKLAQAAFARAAEQVIAVAEATGTPLVLWEDGKVVEIDPREFKQRKNRNRTHSRKK